MIAGQLADLRIRRNFTVVRRFELIRLAKWSQSEYGLLTTCCVYTETIVHR